MLLITGPTGNVGQQLVDLLHDTQPPGGWRVASRHPDEQNLHRAISTHGIDIVERGELFIPARSGRTSFLDARDAADVAAMVLK